MFAKNSLLSRFVAIASGARILARSTEASNCLLTLTNKSFVDYLLMASVSNRIVYT